MQKFQCLLFVLKRLCICYYIICMPVPLNITRGHQSKKQILFQINNQVTLSTTNILICILIVDLEKISLIVLLL